MIQGALNTVKLFQRLSKPGPEELLYKRAPVAVAMSGQLVE